MKLNTRPQLRLNPVQRLIQDATHAPARDLAQIENIMREEVFHSTLDWQSREQLSNGARQALARLNEARELYALDQACRMAMFQKMQAEAEFRDCDTVANRSALLAAEDRHQKAKQRLLAQCDHPQPN